MIESAAHLKQLTQVKNTVQEKYMCRIPSSRDFSLLAFLKFRCDRCDVFEIIIYLGVILGV
jgi:hypothetical protein